MYLELACPAVNATAACAVSLLFCQSYHARHALQYLTHESKASTERVAAPVARCRAQKVTQRAMLGARLIYGLASPCRL